MGKCVPRWIDNGFQGLEIIADKLRATIRLFNFCQLGQIGQRVKQLSKPGKLGDNLAAMLKVKDTLRATVHLSFDGRVVKNYHGADAQKRFENEVNILKFLEARGCNFVPRLLEADEKNLKIVTTNCGSRVNHLDEGRLKELFAELEKFGVRHDDPEMRNVTYRQSDGRFCLIDFEFATILSESKTT